MEKIFSHAWKDKRGVKTDEGAEGQQPTSTAEDSYVDDEQVFINCGFIFNPVGPKRRPHHNVSYVNTNIALSTILMWGIRSFGEIVDCTGSFPLKKVGKVSSNFISFRKKLGIAIIKKFYLLMSYFFDFLNTINSKKVQDVCRYKSLSVFLGNFIHVRLPLRKHF